MHHDSRKERRSDRIRWIGRREKENEDSAERRLPKTQILSDDDRDLRRDRLVLRPLYGQALTHRRPDGPARGAVVRTSPKAARATATSSQTELRLINVARASLDELLLDYEDFLRQRGLRQWDKDDPQALEVRAVGKRIDSTDRSDQADGEAYSRWLGSKDPAVVANAIICLIHQANYLLDQQIGGLEQQFVEGGGYSEQLETARLEKRKKDRTDPDQPDRRGYKAPTCPLCKGLMVLRTAKKGSNAGSQFWGCADYPQCKGTVKLA